jgi:hypothetical protein
VQFVLVVAGLASVVRANAQATTFPSMLQEMQRIFINLLLKGTL